MARESFRERNRRRREENAFENLYSYARSAGIPDPKRSAERAARALHADRPAADRLARSRAGRAGGADDDARPDERGERGERADARATRGERADVRATGGEAEAAPMQDPVPHRLEDRTKEQLYARAQELDISGRSQMTKDELIDAIRDQR